MRIRDFLKRRLIRLHPMVVLGSVLGGVTFLIQGSVQWSGTHVPFSEAWPWAVTVFLGSIVLAYIVLKVYDEPLRRWLSRKWLLQVR